MVKMKKQTEKWFRDIGSRRLSGDKLNDYIRFMMLRLPNEMHAPYADEWAERFQNNTEWYRADSISQKILLKINPSKYKRYKNE